MSLIRLNLNKEKKLLLSNTTWLFGDKLIRMILGLAVSIVMARLLGPEELGKWNYAESFFGMFLVLTTLGFDSIIVRDLVKNSSDRNELLGTAAVLKFAGTLTAIVVSYSLISIIRPEDTTVKTINLILALAALFQVFDVIDYWFRSQMLSKYTVIAKNIGFVISSVFKIGLLVQGYSIYLVAFCAHLEFLIAGIILIYNYTRNKWKIKEWKFRFEKAKSIMTSSWPLILSSSAIYVQARIDQVIIGEMLGDAAVGQYSTALRLIEVLGFIPVVISTAYAPIVTRAKLEGNDKYKQVLSQVYKLMFLVFLLTSLPLFFLSKPIVMLLYGPEFIQAGTLLSLFSIRLFFTNFSVAKSLFITNESLFKYTLLTSIIGAVSNIALNFILIPIFGVEGSILATIISFTISVFIVDIFFNNVRFNLMLMIKSIFTFWKLDLIDIKKVGKRHDQT
ncbi:flippase [Paenibacillus provencensis]|uniref:Flippase n=1 Tax=Paenibacillus provencensis TaxID=441151 RepID=A0ABW3PVZ3_9BACL|nr:flippase [Paenibacillus sp. MER 78]MCM3127716.1 flippase [Paenibacillus sp. MER 78]